MKRFRKYIGGSIMAVVALAFSVTITHAQNIVQNGDFESNYTSPPFFAPWQFSNGFDAFINEPSECAGGDDNCVFIGGLAGGQMTQDLSTQVGQVYQFSFYERGDDPGQTERTSLLNVFFGDQEVGSYVEDNKHFGWNYHVFDVVADSSVTELDFQQASATIGAYGYPGVDEVSVTVVPEPSTIYLIGTAFAISFGKRSRAWTRSRHKSH